MFKSAVIAILGRSNVGKSTLLNALVGEKVAIVSPRAQTTRTIIRGILSGEDYQMVFVDTPGLHKPRNRLSTYMMRALTQALDGVDLTMCVFDASQPLLATDREVLRKAGSAEVPCVAVLNKIDLVDKSTLLALMQTLGEYPFIKDIVPISALKRNGTDELLSTLKPLMCEGEAIFDTGMYTDQPERAIAAELIREKAMLQLREEIPHGIGVEILEMSADEDGRQTVSANILCEKESHKGVIIGKGGAMLKLIGTQARKDISYMLDAPVYLQLWVKVRENWRDNPTALRELGYDAKKLTDV